MLIKVHLIFTSRPNGNGHGFSGFGKFTFFIMMPLLVQMLVDKSLGKFISTYDHVLSVALPFLHVNYSALPLLIPSYMLQ
jgi:hypothetical protein